MCKAGRVEDEAARVCGPDDNVRPHGDSKDTSRKLVAERQEKMKQQPNFHWDMEDTGEPHCIRRREILKACPQIKSLMGPDLSTRFKILAAIGVQILSIHLLAGTPWYCWFLCCYTLSACINQGMTLAMHEISHNLGGRKLYQNRFWGLLANLVLVIPAFASFKRYHMEHHRFQGEDIVDVDVPTNFEGWFFSSPARKALWCTLQPLFYGVRPLFLNPKEPTWWEATNIVVCVAFDLTIFYFFGLPGLLYLLFGTLLGMGLHPLAGHFIAEHAVMNEGQETYSYYGPLNWLAFHVGYHNEHHDFPYVAGCNLHKVRALASEYYDDIPHYHSWAKVTWDFIFDPQLSPYSRVKRVMMEGSEIEALQARGGLVQ